jgi:hypothetical protein
MDPQLLHKSLVFRRHSGCCKNCSTLAIRVLHIMHTAGVPAVYNKVDYRHLRYRQREATGVEGTVLRQSPEASDLFIYGISENGSYVRV